MGREKEEAIAMAAWIVIGLIILVWLVASLLDSRVPGHKVFWPWHR